MRLARALRRGLTAEGFVVDVVHDGPAGLARPAHGDYDAVVLDVMLPGLSGYDVVRSLRAEGIWVPVLMLSAKDGEYDQADGLDYGADDYLTKPFSFVVLLARLRALLRRGCPRGPPCSAPATCSSTRPPARSASPDEPVALDPAGVRPAGVPPAQPRPGGHQDRAAGPRLGRRGGHRPERRRGLRRLPAPQDRPRGSLQTVRGRRLPAGSVTGRPAVADQPAGPADAARGDRAWPSPSRSASMVLLRRARPRHRADRRRRAPGPRRRTSSRWPRRARCPTRCRCPARRWCRWSTRAGRVVTRVGQRATGSRRCCARPSWRGPGRGRPLTVPGARAGIAGPLRVVAVPAGRRRPARDGDRGRAGRRPRAQPAACCGRRCWSPTRCCWPCWR